MAQKYVAGIDEAGYGCIAGPLVIGVVMLPVGVDLPGVKDSKKLSDKQRFDLFSGIEDKAAWTHTMYVPAADINKWGVQVVWHKAVQKLIDSLHSRGDQVDVIVDGAMPRIPFVGARCVPGADATISAVSAASILAKCGQVISMEWFAAHYPKFDFTGHNGYGVPKHIEEVKINGAIPGVHRVKYVTTLAKNNGFELRWQPV